jgi:regulator of RNase E activity RraA
MHHAFRINPMPPAAPAAVVEALRSIVTSHLSDNLQRFSGICGLSRLHDSAKLVGTAITVRTRPGDNLILYKALAMMTPGYVLVVDGAGDPVNALVGELMMLYARARGCAGFVIDAAVRDRAAFRDADFPCYARALSHRGPYKHGPGEINVPVTVGGHVVMPGDVVVGDEDGVVSFPPSDAEALIAAALRTAQNESAIKAEIANGKREQAWLERVLAPHGMSIVD